MKEIEVNVAYRWFLGFSLTDINLQHIMNWNKYKRRCFVMANAGLSVTKIASPNPVGIGQPLTYTITARNNGPDTATSVAMKDTIPSGVCISDITVTQGSYCYENGS